MIKAKPSDTSTYVKQASLLSEQITRQELAVILRELVAVRPVSGDVVEFGCYAGTTSVHLARWLVGTLKDLHVYDSFAGLPEKRIQDESPAGEQFKPGELMASKKEFIMNFKKAGLRLPQIHKSWFSDLTPGDIPCKISLAFLDGDYYESVLTPLRLIEKSLSRNGVIIVDDYANESLPGAAKAVDQWRRETSLKTQLKVEQSLAIIRYQSS